MAQKVSRQFVAELGPVHVRFVTHKMALGQGFLRVLRFSLASNICSNAPYSSSPSSSCYCYQKDKWASTGNLVTKRCSFRRKKQVLKVKLA